ncbi:PH domain-containing protein [Amycolatopsis sp. EV170708-02-1]|uniref:PH domain-containing protein n=1 Tax=Amycolatopsis sp. EV170708-02-1 TaxID=2919322 RepID=UPI001F0BE40B|nr:PH domain-containing protein [Amycolatopsis sp. EV170708-02-1]UMP06266.1 PH domain-containing protein [Amycolatopsis sp. EV170708-02-1]
MSTEAPPDPGDWHRLDRRMLLIRPVLDVVKSLPVLIGTVLLGRGNGWEWFGLGVTALTVMVGVSHVLTSRYRIADGQVEWTTGLLLRKHRAIPLDRIRTVDVTSEPKHRLFSLSAVRIGTGRHSAVQGAGDDQLVLDAVSQAEAHRLRTVLLHRKEITETTRPPEQVVAEVDRKWVRYAPFTLSGLAVVGAVFAAVWHFAHQLDIAPENVGPLRDLLDGLADTALWLIVVVAAAGLLVVVSLLSVGGYVLSFWNFKLTRESEGTLHVRRGLITTRSVSIEEERLRGVEVKEPLPLRIAGGARLTAIAGGLREGKGGDKGGGLLLPPAPVGRVHEVAAEVLRENFDPATVPLNRHPRRALTRRLTRAIGGVLLLAAALFGLAWIDFLPSWMWQVALGLVPFAALVGWDRYRNLGHAIVGRYLVSRSGSLARATVAIRREGVTGIVVSRSFFQRRAGLITVTAPIAAGRGGYQVVDVGESAGLAMAEQAAPGLLTPFLRRDAQR